MDPARAFRALGHSHRLAIVRHLMERALACCEGDRAEDCALDSASCRVGDVAESVSCAPSTLSHHLRELADAGIIERARSGRQIYCRIDQDALRRLRAILDPATADRPPPGNSPESAAKRGRSSREGGSHADRHHIPSRR